MLKKVNYFKATVSDTYLFKNSLKPMQIYGGILHQTTKSFNSMTTPQ